MAREGALEDPAVPPDFGASQKHLPWPRGAPDVAGAGPDPAVGAPPPPRAAAPDPDVARAANGRRALLADSDTDVEEEEGPDPDVAPPKRDLPGAPDVGLRTPAPDVARLGSGPGALVVGSDTEAEEEPDVAAEPPSPDVAGRRALVVESDTDGEDPDVGGLGLTPSVPESPDVGRAGRGRWALLGDSETDVEEEEEEDPDVRPRGRRRTPPNVPETPDVRLKMLNPDVWGARTARGAGLEDSETDVEEAEADPDVRPARSWERTQDVPETPDVRPETPDPDVGRLPGTQNSEGGWDPDVATQLFPPPEPDVGSPRRPRTTSTPPGDPDVEEAAPDPDVRLSKPQEAPPNVPETPDVGPQTPDPDVGGLPGTRNSAREEEGGWGPDVATQLFPPLEPDVEEAEADPDVGGLPGTRNLEEEEGGWDPDVATQLFLPPEPDVGSPGRPRTTPTPDPDVEEAAPDPDVRLSRSQKAPPDVPETPDVGPQTPDPDVGGLPGTRNSAREEEGWDPDVATQLFPPPEPDVEEEEADPDVVATQLFPPPERPRRAPTPPGDPDVEDEADPDVRPSRRCKTPRTVPEAPDVGPQTPDPDVGGLPGARNSEGGWDPDVATQLFPEPDVGSPGRPRTTPTPDPDVRLSRSQKAPPNVPEAPDVGPETPDPDVGGLPGTRNSARDEEEGWDPDVATQLFPPPERPQRAPTPPRDPDVEEEADPDVQPSRRCKMPRTVPEAADVRPETPDPDVCGAEIGGVAQREGGEPDVEEAEIDPDVRPSTTPQTVPETPDVRPETPDPDVGGPPGTRNSEGAWDPDVATQLFPPPEPDVGSPGRPRRAPTPPGDPDVEAAPDPDVEEAAPPDPDVEEAAPPDPDVGGPQPFPPSPAAPDVDPAVAARPCPPSPHPDVGGAPGPDPEEAEAPPPPQVRRSLRLAESGGGGACAGPSPSPEGRVRAPRPRPPPRPRPRKSRSQSGPGAAQATPPVPSKGSGRGSVPAPPPQQEEPAGGAKRSLRPRGALGPAPIRVLFTGLVASPELLVALGTLGGTEATSVTECSHLVTDGVRRTLKFLCALGRGVPIVTPEWLLQSSRGGRPLSPGPFLPQDLPRERRFGFRLRPALERARARPLLQGYQVHVTPSVRPCPEDMRDIVTCCGGTFLSQLPREHAPRVLVISCPQDRSLWGPALAAGLPLLSAELLLSGVLRQRLDIAQFLLAPLEPPNPPPKTPNPEKTPQNPARKTPNRPPKPQNPAPNPPQTPPPSPPRTRSGRRPPQKTPNSGAPPKTPKPPQKPPKRPRGRSEDPDPDFGVREPPRTRSRREPPQNHPRDPSSSGKTQKTPNPTQKNPNPTQNAPKQSRAPPGDPNPNSGDPDPPQEPPRTRSGRRPPPNSGTPRKTPNPAPKTTKRPQSAPNSTQKRPRGPHPDSGVPESPPSPPRTRSRRGPLRNP